MDSVKTLLSQQRLQSTVHFRHTITTNEKGLTRYQTPCQMPDVPQAGTLHQYGMYLIAITIKVGNMLRSITQTMKRKQCHLVTG
jgi:hypothetical protein